MRSAPEGSRAIPTVVTSGLGTVDAIWRTTSGSVWAAAVTPNGGPGQVEVNSAVSMGRPAAAGTAASAVTVVMQRANGSLAAAIYDPGNGWIGPRTAQPGRGELAALGGELVWQRCRSLLAGERRQPVVVGRLRRLRGATTAGLQPGPVGVLAAAPATRGGRRRR